MKKLAIYVLFILWHHVVLADSVIVNDITQLTPISVAKIAQPTSTTEVVELIKNHHGPIAIAGGKYSMGGQTATEQALQIDINHLNHIIAFDPDNKEITIETGVNWRQIQEQIDPYNLSVKIMQSYADFTVGGSLGVNVHGRYVGEGPLILSVKQIKIVLADGSLITASPTQNTTIFYGAIGGYGGLGVITEATLQLVENNKLERISQLMPINQYKIYFLKNISNNKEAVFHNTVIYPPDYKQVRAVTYIKTNKPLTITDRLQDKNQDYSKLHKQIAIVTSNNLGKQLRKLYDKTDYRKELVVWRNYEASYNVAELGPIATQDSSFVLQEYFVPIEQFDNFYPKLIKILRANKVNVINISIRHAKQDSGSLLAWAKTDVFAFVIYYQQATTAQAKAKVGEWTRQLIDAVLSCQGSYYLPYQIHASKEQFNRAYPNAQQFFKLKQQVDPSNKFRNKLLDRYNDN
ncbi:FAD-dependent oxidoreductase [Entomomonas sp. E2T0]|uniref:FAD-dependent oxidoreductase n=1 Tax=Entomomonas sp. E2T0 TaxID=2930213 RepID=UPI00222838A2|nr:FAD-dependent oxidoreductase [Entomomonas sp. E2T0]UYZ83875.1 FAD-dependent oxidoreductase [Entomomonas sp. E2T0]